MPSKIKPQPAGAKPVINSLKTLMLHDVTNHQPPVNAAARRPQVVPPAITRTANHARHHFPRSAQS